MDEKLFDTARKVGTPIGLAGLAFAVFYLIIKRMLALDIFPQLAQDQTFQFINRLADYVFWLALLAMVLGVIAYIYVHYSGRPPAATTLAGNVYFANDMPVHGARVFVEGDNRREDTNEDGGFKIEVKPQAAWTVRAVYKESSAQTVVLREHATEAVRLVLPEDATPEPPAPPTPPINKNPGGDRVAYGDVLHDHARKYTYEDNRGGQAAPRATLEENIRAAYRIIREYEAMRLEETDRPEAQARAKRHIAAQYANIRELLAEYTPRYAAVMPADVREIAEYCMEKGN